MTTHSETPDPEQTLTDALAAAQKTLGHLSRASSPGNLKSQ